ncbi:SCO family protein [Halopiger xanaduensis]|uniref:Electron transport protein SCO1/SenC n=1 Tax=Halopiger xanaduensis (strain DSM 18323 / JCM 14033 / SH-6) TaxID=797210 RepID=F8DEG2_HALXS|nr:SCO family protein [Halopiger xanaduensis]AEH39413.1 electron transport protein SCO1/SenC [Halopiger xanaduensis SH-6]
MNRRLYLRSIAASSVAATAGCLDTLSIAGDDGDMILEPPERDLSEATHPSYGDEFPTASVPAPLTGETVSTDQYEGERAMLVTFFYTSCPDGVCPALILRLRRAQEVAAEEGYSDSAAFLAMTFDPERDTADVLRTYADQQGVDLEAGNWHFLRPERYEDAKSIVADQYGLPIEKRDAEKYDDLEYMFPHFAYIFLVNERGLVERAYPDGATIATSKLVDDFEAVATS